MWCVWWGIKLVFNLICGCGLLVDSLFFLIWFVFIMLYVLIVEDDFNSLLGFIVLFVVDGFLVDMVMLFVEVCMVFGCLIFDVVFVDLNLLDGSGFDLF